MFQRLLTAACLLALPSISTAQSVKLPDTITGIPGQWIVVAPTAVDGGKPNWRIDPLLQEVNLGALLPDEYVSKLKGKVVSAKAPGQYKVESWNAKGDVASDIAVTWVIIVGEIKPDPKPVDPKPIDPKPEPISDAPIPLPGLRLMIVYETADLSKLTPSQHAIILGKKARDWMDANTVKGPTGEPERRIWDKDQPLAKTDKHWQDVMARTIKRPDFRLPWLVISNGKTGYEGPLPNDVDTLISLGEKFK